MINRLTKRRAKKRN